MAKEFNEIWTYTGRRMDVRGKIAYTYQDEQGSTLVYDKPITGSVVGGRYRVAATREGDAEGNVTTRVIPKHYEYLGMSDTGHVTSWVAEDCIAVTERDVKNREKRDGADQLSTCTLGDLREKLRQLPGPQRRVLMISIMEVLSR